jgi:hypothetical protein
MKAAFLVALAVTTACGARVSIGELSSGEVIEGGGLVADAAPETDASPGEEEGDGGATYEPCADKGCGEDCALCAPDDPMCVETAVPKACDPSGICTDAVVTCDEPVDAGGAYDPCAGKACGESCRLCPPTDINCFEPAVIKQCNLAGKCNSDPPGC